MISEHSTLQPIQGGILGKNEYFHEAIDRKNVAVAAKLFHEGATLLHKIVVNGQFLDDCIEGKHFNLAALFLENCLPNLVCDKKGRHLFEKYMLNKNIEAVELFLKHGANPNGHTEQNIPFIWSALVSLDEKLTRLLIQYHVETKCIEKWMSNGASMQDEILRIALAIGNVDLMRSVLSIPFSQKAVTEGLNYCLEIKANGYDQIAQLLKQCEIKSDSSHTAVENLLVKNFEGLQLEEDILRYAKAGNLQEVKKLFECRNKILDMQALLHNAFLSGNKNMVRFVLKRGGDPNFDIQGKSAISIAFEQNDWKMMHLFLQYDVYIQVREFTDMIEKAVCEKRSKVVKLLLFYYKQRVKKDGNSCPLELPKNIMAMAVQAKKWITIYYLLQCNLTPSEFEMRSLLVGCVRDSRAEYILHLLNLAKQYTLEVVFYEELFLKAMQMVTGLENRELASTKTWEIIKYLILCGLGPKLEDMPVLLTQAIANKQNEVVDAILQKTHLESIDKPQQTSCILKAIEEAKGIDFPWNPSFSILRSLLSCFIVDEGEHMSLIEEEVKKAQNFVVTQIFKEKWKVSW